MSVVADVLDRYRAATVARNQWFPLWQELADVLHPVRGGFTSQQQSGQISTRIYDSAPQQARRGLATAIGGLLMPSTSHWFWMKAKDEALNEDDEAKRWLDLAGDRMWSGVYAPDARFLQSTGAVNDDLATFGLGYLWMDENRARDGLSFQALHLRDVAIEANADGLIDTAYICRRFTAKQAKQKFPDAVLESVEEDLRNGHRSGEARLHEFVQVVYPRGDRDYSRSDAPGMAYGSLTVAVKDEAVVAEGGYHEMPLAPAQWERSAGELYPRSPGMLALPDARVLQRMGKTLLIGGERAVDPPTWVADDGMLSAVRTFPGGLTVVSADIVRDTGGRPIGQLDMGANIPVGRDMQADYRAQVEAAFFRNVFSLPIEVAGKMTATEVMERKEEFLRTIGPVMGQLESDYRARIVTRVFGIMMRAGALPPPPEQLRGAEIEFEFMSPVQQAKRQIEAAGMGRAFEFIAPLAQAQPEMLDHFDGDEIVRDLPEIFGIKQTWLRPKDRVEALREQRAEAQQAAEAMAGAGAAADVGKTVADIEATAMKAQA